ncbi:hypothetical protein M0657_001202 [Pyricularia oryzae]|uniref:Uncharacterized protein n=2 Tax=Pyricularia oryzae TaxID=318829 RepID=A0A4P7NPA3_PYROR|nr:hypothetical protein OOU_Y34scaffold00624g96 [Pyricularia oryzae Y34]KAI7923762.1 hypothetical protein M9X92_004211 [Pyricularia oryzae]KAI7931248.1 hypothetical protein M0657_001202 [Pyricularia oryzae]QBZ63992.1 hypothetical protein PoMZ_05683 [Pyricularia oryzae]
MGSDQDRKFSWLITIDYCPSAFCRRGQRPECTLRSLLELLPGYLRLSSLLLQFPA